ncbi:Y-family DNA polymerase [Roseobacter sinensis]|uniref:DNA-directed DNA polymerase n=1 Tax=Roseobacter sinensis TaxID=2931391 RepID=A0ABT3BI05_9RHOB|nr:DNA polymerase Y family protein [Roseobacter sp. WL0113]MCV3272828.1 DNA polymerase Y family protein [Roseobacter sp. WL0113]
MARIGNAPSDDLPVALVAEGPHGQVIHATNRAARLAGIAIGARVVDMRAVCPTLQVEYADLAGDARALGRLALWARRWCPWTVVDGADGLILDTTGSDHLLGGEAAMLVEMETRLSLLGLTARLAVAPTWGAAWALARYGPVRAICTEETRAADLHPLPVAALRLEAETVLLLGRLGLKTIGQLSEVPRLSLTRRFARSTLEANPLLRLDQAMGRLAEPVASQEARPRIIAQAKLPEPIMDPTAYLPQLGEEVCAQLEREGAGCRRLTLVVYRTDGEISRLKVATAAPSRAPAHLCRLFDDRLERLDPGFGFDLITLEAGMIEPVKTVQAQLGGGSDGGVPLSHLIDRLTARLGPRAVKTPVLKESHMPERAAQWAPAMAGAGADPLTPAQERPLRLLDPPEEIRVLYAVPEGPPAQFIWRRQTHRVVRYAGPERIAPEWWSDRPGTRLRDYFRIEDQAGCRYWLYREGLHEDGRGGDPRWFVHGCFA